MIGLRYPSAREEAPGVFTDDVPPNSKKTGPAWHCMHGRIQKYVCMCVCKKGTNGRSMTMQAAEAFVKTDHLEAPPFHSIHSFS
jgi:hypothetical protein